MGYYPRVSLLHQAGHKSVSGSTAPVHSNDNLGLRNRLAAMPIISAQHDGHVAASTFNRMGLLHAGLIEALTHILVENNKTTTLHSVQGPEKTPYANGQVVRNYAIIINMTLICSNSICDITLIASNMLLSHCYIQPCLKPVLGWHNRRRVPGRGWGVLAIWWFQNN